MQLKCPCCNAAFSLEAALGIDAGRSALLRALRMPAPLAGELAQYLGMFRAAGRALAFARVEKLLDELLPMIEAGSVSRAGVSRPCELAHWQAGIERMIEARDTARLQLPLKSHGYLLEIVFGLADAADAQRERERETTLRNQRAGTRPAPNAPAPSPEARALHDRIARIRADQELGLIDADETARRIAAAKEGNRV